jgi:hypothetical protein
MDNKIEYEFLNDPTTDPTQTCPIRIKTGKYLGIVYKYGKISLKEENDDLNVTMEIDILNAPEDFDRNEREFTHTVGEIFVQIVESGVEVKRNEVVDLEDDVHQDS